MSSIQRLATLRQRLLDRFGSSGVHMLEHGAVGGAAVGLWVTFPAAAVLLLIAVGAAPKRAGPLAVFSEVLSLLKSEDARIQESYLFGAFLGGSAGGLGVGAGLRTAVRVTGVDVPTATEVLRLLV